MGGRCRQRWVLVWGYSSPGSGSGASIPTEMPYGTTSPTAPCSAQSGTGLLKSLPTTPSNDSTSPGVYRHPSRLSNDRFSKSTSTTWSIAFARTGGMGPLCTEVAGDRTLSPCWAGAHAGWMFERWIQAIAAPGPSPGSNRHTFPVLYR